MILNAISDLIETEIDRSVDESRSYNKTRHDYDDAVAFIRRKTGSLTDEAGPDLSARVMRGFYRSAAREAKEAGVPVGHVVYQRALDMGYIPRRKPGPARAPHLGTRMAPSVQPVRERSDFGGFIKQLHREMGWVS